MIGIIVAIIPQRYPQRIVAVIVVEIRPHRWGWKVFEAPGVESFFGAKDQAIGYASWSAVCRKASPN
jgi:hypothetical protein